MADITKGLKDFWMKSMEAIGNTASNIASNTKFKVEEMNMLNRRREILTDFGAKAYALWQKGERDIFPDELRTQLEELSHLDEKLNDLRAEKYGSGIVEPDAANSDAEEHPDGETKENPSSDETAADASNEADPDVKDAEEDEPPCDTGTDPSEASCGPVSEAPFVVEEQPSIAEDCSLESASQEAAEVAAQGDHGENDIPVPEVSQKGPAGDGSLSDTINELFEKVPSVESMAEKMNSALDQMGSNLKQFSEKMDQHLDRFSEQVSKTFQSDDAGSDSSDSSEK